MKNILLIIISMIVLHACTSIWNSGDLQKWVIKEAVKSGCEPDSIVLDDWYTQVKKENIWYGQCNHKDSGKPMKVEVGVDKVWKPS